MTNAKKMVAGALLRVLMPGVMSSPALAINDALVPAENYAPANAAGRPSASALAAAGTCSPSFRAPQQSSFERATSLDRYKSCRI